MEPRAEQKTAKQATSFNSQSLAPNFQPQNVKKILHESQGGKSASPNERLLGSRLPSYFAKSSEANFTTVTAATGQMIMNNQKFMQPAEQHTGPQKNSHSNTDTSYRHNSFIGAQMPRASINNNHNQSN